jgi:hypothetical protein
MVPGSASGAACWPRSMTKARLGGPERSWTAASFLPKRGACVGKTKRGKGTNGLAPKFGFEPELQSLNQNYEELQVKNPAFCLRKDELQSGNDEDRSQRSAYAVAL